MNNRTDKILLGVLLLSLAFYCLSVLSYLEIIPNPLPWELYTLLARITIGSSAVPAFCLQLLLCRRKRHWIAAIPAVAVIGAALWFTYGFFTATGWDTLGWGILLVLSIAPAAGCALGWAAYGLYCICKRGDTRG